MRGEVSRTGGRNAVGVKIGHLRTYIKDGTPAVSGMSCHMLRNCERLLQRMANCEQHPPSFQTKP